VSGTFNAKATHGLHAPAITKSTSIDTTRSLMDASGNTVRSVHLTGNVDVTFDESASPPTRTFNGTVTAEFANGDKNVVTIANVVRTSPRDCRWPISGSITGTKADGTTHTIAFGPDCGKATIDGSAVDLPAKGPGPGGRGDHGGRGGRNSRGGGPHW
jgi:hypothetical protein